MKLFAILAGVGNTSKKERVESMRRMKVLLVVQECDPAGMSSPFIGFQLFDQIRRFAEVTLVTSEKYRPNLESQGVTCEVHYLKPKSVMRGYANFLANRLFPTMTNWALRHLLSYPLYSEFNRKVYKRFRQSVESGHYDVVHALTPMIPRYPYKIAKACTRTPFILGPVNGGIPCPPQFEEIQNKEYSYSTVLRNLSRHLPGYRATYKSVSRLLVGSTRTQELLTSWMPELEGKSHLLAENGIPESALKSWTKRENPECQLLFVGRLCPVKGIDMLLEALRWVEEPWHLTLVGEGVERRALEQQAAKQGIAKQITFAGWVAQEQTWAYYRSSDIFCFPSVRESGGAVVMEAMASALPSIVFNYGGFTEYLDDASALKLELGSRDKMPMKLAEAIRSLIRDPEKRERMGRAALSQVYRQTWEAKGRSLAEVYSQACSSEGAVGLR
jgi:glycosyltransferase involved in cell wall biosynthesis